eukprot:1180682-Prorocentrum_minimum.AAC.1
MAVWSPSLPRRHRPWRPRRGVESGQHERSLRRIAGLPRPIARVLLPGTECQRTNHARGERIFLERWPITRVESGQHERSLRFDGLPPGTESQRTNQARGERIFQQRWPITLGEGHRHDVCGAGAGQSHKARGHVFQRGGDQWREARGHHPGVGTNGARRGGIYPGASPPGRWRRLANWRRIVMGSGFRSNPPPRPDLGGGMEADRRPAPEHHHTRPKQ